MKLEDLKIFLWYCVTEPLRNIRDTFKDIASGAKKDLQNLKTWSQFMILLSAAIIALKDIPTSILFFGVGVFMWLYYEWRRGYYHYRWNQRHLERIRTMKPKKEND